MRISGFTTVKNADKLYYPIAESISSILPIVDEFIVALGDNDPDDKTQQLIEQINSPKIKIIHSAWDTTAYPSGTILARQTDVAKSHCSGDWLFYLQADEAVHEADLPIIQAACKKYLNVLEVDGFVFNYLHFWGDYNHHHKSHVWYPREIRIIRNRPDIRSFGDAQSFRIDPNFDGKSYHNKIGTKKLQIVELKARIFHYGWVRPPWLMQTKSKSFEGIYHGKQKSEQMFKNRPDHFDYGPLNIVPVFKGSHPKAMLPFIAKFNWAEYLYNKAPNKLPPPALHAHQKLKYRILSFIEYTFLGGRKIAKPNWIKIKPRI